MVQVTKTSKFVRLITSREQIEAQNPFMTSQDHRGEKPPSIMKLNLNNRKLKVETMVLVQ